MRRDRSLASTTTNMSRGGGDLGTDAHGLLFLETNYFSNLGTRSMIEPVIGLDGIRDEEQVFAPHAYDLVTDTELAHTANDARLS